MSNYCIINLSFTGMLAAVSPRAMISREKYFQIQRTKKLDVIAHAEEKLTNPARAPATESQNGGF